MQTEHPTPSDPLGEQTNRSWFNRFSWLAFAFSIAVVIGMFIALSFFAHPQTDDLCAYDDIRDLGYANTIAHVYHTWTGRYFYITVEGAILAQMDLIEDFWLVGICTMAILLLSIFVLVRTVTRGLASWWHAVGLTIGLLTVYCAMLPTPARAFYWLTGAATNQLVLILSLFAFALLLRDPTPMGKFKRAVLIIVSALLMSAAIGTYDNTIPMLCGILLGATALALYTRNPRRLQFSIVFVVALISSAIVMLAPGNDVRAAHFEKAPLLQAIDYSVTNSLKWLIPYVLSPTVLLASLLFVPTGWRVGRKLRAIANNKPAWMLGVVILWSLMLICSWLPAQYVMQGNPPPRTLNTTSMFLLVGLFGSIAVFCAQVPDAQRRDLHLPVGLLATARFALAAVLLTQGNGLTALVQLKEQARDFDLAMHQRYDIIRQAKARGETEVILPPLPVQPTLLLPKGKDITPDPIEYPNFAVCTYWEIDSIRIEDDGSLESTDDTDAP